MNEVAKFTASIASTSLSYNNESKFRPFPQFIKEIRQNSEPTQTGLFLNNHYGDYYQRFPRMYIRNIFPILSFQSRIERKIMSQLEIL